MSKSSPATVDLPLVKIRTPWSTAEIYLHGAHVAGFQKNGEPPLIFMSAKSYFAPRQGDSRRRADLFSVVRQPRRRTVARLCAHRRNGNWSKRPSRHDGTVTLQFALPEIPGREAWKNLRTEFIVTVADTLTMELIAANESCGETLEIENCLHTYFHVGDIGAVSLTGLQGAPFDDFAVRRQRRAPGRASDAVLRITRGNQPRLSRPHRHRGNPR